MRIRREGFVFVLLAGVICSTLSWAAPQAAGAVTVLRGGTLIDGTGAEPLAGSVVVIEGGRIRDVGREGSVSVPAGATVIDARGKFILPGLIDGHVHYKGWDGELYLNHGVTTVVDIGNLTEWILAQRDGEAKGKIRGPRILAAGNPIRGPFPSPQTFRRLHHIMVPTIEGAREEARKRVSQGVDVLKLYDGLTKEMLQVTIQEARAKGLAAIGHTTDAWQAVEVGYDAIVHTTGIARATLQDGARAGDADPHASMDFQKVDRLVDALVKRGVAWNPTVRAQWNWAHRDKFQREDFELLFNNVNLSYVPVDYRLGILKEYNEGGLPRFWNLLTPDEQQMHLKAYKNVIEAVRRFARKGGKIITGSDTMSTGGLSLHQELQILVDDVGLAPMEALLTVTQNPAELYRVADGLGTVQKGKSADLILISANPLENIRNTRRIERVWKRGEPVELGYHLEYYNPLPKNVPEDTGHIFPSPFLQEISPKVGTEGDGSVELTVSGSGFVPYSVALFNGIRVRTVYRDDFTLVASVPAELLRKAGTYPVTVVNPRPVGSVNAPGQSDLIPFGLRGDTSNPLYFIVKFR
ncbi:MAG: amidohydrolase family protein [Acidobacteria bacterium]|nr:amidohydrolase family protein [Acidobacteriota bacterium]